MKKKSAVLTGEERDVLILAAMHGQHLGNTEIARRLGISVSRVKTLVHQACVKLGAHNRNEAVFFAIREGEISISEFYSVEELAEILSSLGPDILRKMADILRRGPERGHLPDEGEQVIHTGRRQDGILTNRERDVLVLVGRGLTNKEIADRLCITIAAVRTFLNRACAKLGVRKRGDALVLALKQREISVHDVSSLGELLQFVDSLGAESVEEMAQLMERKLGQEPVPTGG